MLEVIAISKEDTKVIENSKANQIEFCTNLERGGLSPTVFELHESLKKIKKPLRVMLRYHWNTFKITNSQMEQIIKFVNEVNDLDFSGYVWGAITDKKEIDFKNLEKIIKILGNKNLTFHKAFDQVKDKQGQLKKLLKYRQIRFVLTSGGDGSPLNNLDFFKNVPKKLKNRILVGGQVDMKVILTLKKLGYNNFHIGRKARFNNSYEYAINKEEVNKLALL